MADSRMAKILKRLTKKNEEVQEPTTEERDMNKINELDLGIEEVAGSITCPKEVEKASCPFQEELRKSPLIPLTKPPKSFEDKLDETWICFSEDGELVHRELQTCTAEEFGKWLCWVYPPAKEFLKTHQKNYEKHENRKNEFLNIVTFLTRLPKAFKAYGESSFLPQKDEKKTDKKAGGKNE